MEVREGKKSLGMRPKNNTLKLQACPIYILFLMQEGIHLDISNPHILKESIKCIRHNIYNIQINYDFTSNKI